MTMHEEMWSLYGRDVDGCRTALSAIAQELDEVSVPIAIRARANQIAAVARRLKQICDDMEAAEGDEK